MSPSNLLSISVIYYIHIKKQLVRDLASRLHVNLFITEICFNWMSFTFGDESLLSHTRPSQIFRFQIHSLFDF